MGHTKFRTSLKPKTSPLCLQPVSLWPLALYWRLPDTCTKLHQPPTIRFYSRSKNACVQISPIFIKINEFIKIKNIAANSV